MRHDRRDAAGAGIALVLTHLVLATPAESSTGDAAMTAKVNQISASIRQGAQAFIRTEYTYLCFLLASLYVLISAAIDWRTGICYLVGATLSAACGYIGMMIATAANGRCAFQAEKGLNNALRVAFNAGT